MLAILIVHSGGRRKIVAYQNDSSSDNYVVGPHFQSETSMMILLVLLYV